jgi:outer membrane lipoprotein carrier protein
MKQIATLLIAACALSAGATGLESLETFVKTVKTARTDFTQVVTMPAKGGHPQGQGQRAAVGARGFSLG